MVGAKMAVQIYHRWSAIVSDETLRCKAGVGSTPTHYNNFPFLQLLFRFVGIFATHEGCKRPTGDAFVYHEGETATMF